MVIVTDKRKFIRATKFDNSLLILSPYEKNEISLPKQCQKLKLLCPTARHILHRLYYWIKLPGIPYRKL
jgi:hypothetical protein